jgi:ataxia telangiectasia mutated family protein
LFTPILHLVLLSEYEHKQDARAAVSTAFKSLFREVGPSTAPHAKAALQAINYLRKQPVPKENTNADREYWLEVEHVGAGRAAEYCHLHSTALLLAETAPAQRNTQRGSRRSSAVAQPTIPDDLLLSIYRNIDEPDSFYGVQQDSSLASVLNRLDYEAEGFKSLLFRGAQADSEMRRQHSISANNAGGLISALNYLNLNSLTSVLLSHEQFHPTGSDTAGLALDTARKLDQWDIRASEHASSEPSIIYGVLQGISNATSAGEIRRRIDQGFSNALGTITAVDTSPKLMRAGLRTLSVLTEVDDVMASLSRDDLEDAFSSMERRIRWMQSAQ